MKVTGQILLIMAQTLADSLTKDKDQNGFIICFETRKKSFCDFYEMQSAIPVEVGNDFK